MKHDTKTESVFVRMTPKERQLLERMADREARTMSQIILMALQDRAQKKGYVKRA